MGALCSLWSTHGDVPGLAGDAVAQEATYSNPRFSYSPLKKCLSECVFRKTAPLLARFLFMGSERPIPHCVFVVLGLPPRFSTLAVW